jgi:hypothetical protein
LLTAIDSTANPLPNNEPSRPRDCCDLAKEDRCQRFGTYKDIDIVLEQQQRTLNNRTRKTRLVWRENGMVLLVIQFALHLQDDTALQKESLSRTDKLSRPDFRNRDGLNEAERLYRKLEDAKAFKRWLYEELEKITSHILATKTPQTTYDDATHLLYRPIAKDTHTFYIKKLGFCCDRIREHYNLSGPTKDDFLNHMRNTEMVDGSPYISMTDSPGHAYRRFKDRADQIALIDYHKLRDMGFHAGPALDMARAFKTPADWDIMGGHDYLAEFWVPANCVIATVAWPAFEKVLIEQRIMDRRECFIAITFSAEAGS